MEKKIYKAYTISENGKREYLNSPIIIIELDDSKKIEINLENEDTSPFSGTFSLSTGTAIGKNNNNPEKKNEMFYVEAGAANLLFIGVNQYHDSDMDSI
ncbi:hypothetical protein [Chryseobacterium sp.]|uniref:hypothetical protein n=1 Tax=Chryseobacterium sp. TaxID=1871047 RepID=UPI0025B82369|nr:hypothetical protein [Chryseobacterium sp.]MBV8325182.1 hypothetical protein [Chryseobacterium sp.]